MFASITQVQSYYSFFILLLDETIMAQNNSVFVFVRKTSNESRGRQNFRIDMNQVRNLKSLGFTWKKKQTYLESPRAFDSHVSTIVHFVVDGVAKLVSVSVIV